MSERDTIRDAFLEGTQLIYSTLFSDSIIFSLLDEAHSSVDDIYKESSNKVYFASVTLHGKVELKETREETPDLGVIKVLTVKIPTKELIDHQIPLSDFSKLRAAKIDYKGESYFVDSVTPGTNIVDTFLFYEFSANNRGC